MSQHRFSLTGLLLPVTLPFVLGTLLSFIADDETEPSQEVRPETLVRSLDPPLLGQVISRNSGQHYSRQELTYSLRQESILERALGARVINTADGIPLTLTAMGRDWRHHPANAYLTGTIPFQADSIWVPLQTIAQRLRYVLDDRLFRGRKEVWQTSGEAYDFMRGDCEDHAILLADWLIDMGHDARVVLGDYKGEGHAWVVLFRHGQTFLLEATDKQQRRRYPLASLMPEYQPKYMFNRDNFWQNTGSERTTDYTTDAGSERWQLLSQFRTL